MNNKICVNCNQSNALDMRFCGNCGAELSQISADDLPPTVLGGNFGTGSLKNGFSFTFAVGGGGAHVLELKTSLMSKHYDFMIPAGGNFLAQINYSRATGRFGSELSFNRF